MNHSKYNHTNFFGRFIAAGTEDPTTAARHLQISTPFFIRMRSLLEGFSNQKYNFLHVKIQGSKDIDEHTATEIIHACINTSRHFLGENHSLKIDRNLTLIHVPPLPDCSTSHIERKKKTQLAVELYQWLFFENKTGELLHKKLLPVGDEEYQVSLKKELTKKIASLKAHKKRPPAKNALQHKVKLWTRKEEKLTNRIEEIRSSIISANERRKKVKSINSTLESHTKNINDIKKFREQVRLAVQKGQKIVFSFLRCKKEEAGSQVFLSNLDRVFNARGHVDNQITALLKSASFIFDSTSVMQAEGGRVGGFASIVERHLRLFEFNPGDLNKSLKYVVSGILPDNEDPKLATLVEELYTSLDIPGVTQRKHLEYLVRQSSGKRKPKAEDYLEYAFERVRDISQGQLLNIFRTLIELGVTQIPDRCIELGVSRFRHPAKLFKQFFVFSDSYKPRQVGSLPKIFQEIARFDRYIELGIDGFGMADEVRRLEEILKHSSIVAIVDGTNYHPELMSEIYGEKVEGDVENTNERWGKYVRPSERLVSAFTSKLLQGEVSEELKHSTLIKVSEPSKKDKVEEKLYKIFLDVDLGLTPDLSEINKVLADLTTFDANTIIVLNAESVNDPDQYMQFISLLKKYRLKVILRTRESFPGVPQILIQPFIDHKVADRLKQESKSLALTFDLKMPIESEVIDFMVGQVAKLRQPGNDPLNLALQVLRSAAENANLLGEDQITKQDVISALPNIFHLADSEQMRNRITAIDEFAKRAPMEVLGQHAAIKTIADRMKSHILGLRDPSRPLTLLLPGPTGVGKTELMIKFSLAADIPYFQVQGAEFAEEHTISRLVGSPSGYVGPDKGILVEFLEKNNTGLVFFDEIEKMHPAVYTALMNFFDKATITAGDGKTITRPGMVIVGASNAGADKLHRQMSEREVRDTLSEYFLDRQGNKRPELVRRFEPVMMLAIEKDDFKAIICGALKSIGNRYGFVNANMHLIGVDEHAIDLLYRSSLDVCAYSEKGLKTSYIGFRDSTQPRDTYDLFYDMRHISCAVDELAGESIRALAEEQYHKGQNYHRGNARRVILTGCSESGKIKLVDANVGI